ncbi:hypothetical protein [Guptibacillus hwajinpoensis]|uniref:hypothetical protein n=1 Tax=Guptibacillus hwajinpoensis TaxID=208199 RepID=UPI001CFD6954|nr:hypothetical protein [Pseudalkalibacillus hwajinpoensis]WLR57945.1 hypothetical protein LC071_11575 [Pseudalkalibacillus hwajinpoensis]
MENKRFGLLVGYYNGIYHFTSPNYFHENIPEHVLGNIYCPAFVIILGGTLITIIGILSILFIQKSEIKHKKQAYKIPRYKEKTHFSDLLKWRPMMTNPIGHHRA